MIIELVCHLNIFHGLFVGYLMNTMSHRGDFFLSNRKMG